MRTRESLRGVLRRITSPQRPDEETLEALEEALILADVGPAVALRLVENLRQDVVGDESPRERLRKAMLEILARSSSAVTAPSEGQPRVVLLVGVNGSGKTTSVAKLAARYVAQGHSVILGAADTFRAAAVDQLEVWAKKINANIIKSDGGADPASVAYKALDYGKKNNFDYLLIDTAGRLQNKKNLMDEFKKITTVVKKIDSTSPHETFLILDATTGQSAINQVEEFQKITPITGIIMTKLDGTAKGGILLAIGRKFKLPIIALGMGEKEDDLQTFNAEYFANALMSL